MKRVVVLSLVLAICVSVPAHGGSSVSVMDVNSPWFGLIREYANPFDPDLNRTVTTSETKITVSSGWSEGIMLSNLVRRADGTSVSAAGGRAQGPPGADGVEALPGIASVTFQSLQAPFQVGTIITHQRVADQFTAPMPYSIQLGTGGDMCDWSTVPTSMTGAGAMPKGMSTFEIQTLSSVVTCDSFRLNIDTAYNPNDRRYQGDFNEVLLLPDRLEYIPNTEIKVTANDTITTNQPGALLDMRGQDSWGSRPGGTLTFEFLGLAAGETRQVDSIVLWSMNDGNCAIFTIKDGNGNVIADVNITNDSIGWVLPIQFDRSIHTDKIIFEFASSGLPGDRHNLREVMFFTNLDRIPEPATMSLLALGGLALLRRRR